MKRLYIIKLVYFLFLFLILTGSNLYLGPITAKYVMGLVLFVLLIIRDHRLIMDRCFRMYCIFIITFFLSSVVCGFTSSFFVTFFNYYFIAYVGWRATNLLVNENEDFAKYVIYIILGIGAFDVLVTLSQMTLNVGWYTPIETLFKFPTRESQIEAMESALRYKEIFSYAITGIFGNAIKNGWYLAVCSVLSMIFVHQKGRIIFYIVPIFYLAGVFACQERSALAAALLMILIFSMRVFKTVSIFKRLAMVVVVVAAAVYVGGYMIDFSNENKLRYSALGMDDTGRSGILDDFYGYIASNPILPNYYDMRNQMVSPPHNVFFNAFVYGGIISFIVICSILVIQIKTSYRAYFKHRLLNQNVVVTVCICAWSTFTLNSLFHNQSIVTGELLPWLLWSIIYTLYQKYNFDVKLK